MNSTLSTPGFWTLLGHLPKCGYSIHRAVFCGGKNVKRTESICQFFHAGMLVKVLQAEAMRETGLGFQGEDWGRGRGPQ